MMRSAFVLVAARAGRRIPPEVAALVADRATPHVHFAPARHASWRSTSAEVLVGAWAEQGTTLDASAPRWLHGDGSFAAASGHARVRGDPWTGRTWAAAAATIDPCGGPGAAAHLTGIFAAVHADAAGNAVVAGHELGAAYLFWGEHRDYDVVATTPALAAHALSPTARPARDAFAATGLAHTRARVGPRTGFAGVEALPPGRSVHVTPEHGARITTITAPWMPDDRLRSLSETELVDHAEALLVEAVRAAATYPAEERVVDLTGGKDSRLVLAGILLAGLAGEFRFRTDGPPGLADVVVATELAERFGLEHHAGVPAGQYDASYEDRVRVFIASTAAMNTPAQLKSRPLDLPDAIRLNGLFGEPLRSYVQRRLDGPADVAAFFTKRFGKLGLLRPEAAARWTAIISADVEHDRTAEATPHDLLDAFQLRNRVIPGVGLREELGGIPRLIPLAQGGLLQVAFALGSDARQSARLHRELMGRASPDLAGHRFAEHVLAVPPKRPPVPQRPGTRASSTAGVPPSLPLEQQGRKEENWAMVRRQQARVDHRRQLVTDVLADRTSEAWEHLDPAKVDDALGRYASLDAQELQELAGAAGAVIWLEG